MTIAFRAGCTHMRIAVVFASFRYIAGVSMFEPTSLWLTVYDSETGIELTIRSTHELESKILVATFPNEQKVECALELEPKTPSNRTDFMRIWTAQLDKFAQFRNGTTSENTEFVRYILSGLSAIHKIWSPLENRRFYSDRDQYKDLVERFNFDVPEEDEISRI